MEKWLEVEMFRSVTVRAPGLVNPQLQQHQDRWHVVASPVRHLPQACPPTSAPHLERGFEQPLSAPKPPLCQLYFHPKPLHGSSSALSAKTRCHCSSALVGPCLFDLADSCCAELFALKKDCLCCGDCIPYACAHPYVWHTPSTHIPCTQSFCEGIALSCGC